MSGATTASASTNSNPSSAGATSPARYSASPTGSTPSSVVGRMENARFMLTQVALNQPRVKSLNERTALAYFW